MKTQLIFPKSRTTCEVRRRIPVASTTMPGRTRGFTTVPDGEEEIYYETSIDLKLLDFMAKRAAHNKSGVCRDGALIVRVTARNRIGEGAPLAEWEKDLR